MDYSFERHQNCKNFYQNNWMMSEGKYICELTGELYFLDEIPKGCVKGFKNFEFPKGVYKPENNCKIYEFKMRNNNEN